MTVAFWCVLLAAGFPYLWIAYAKATRRFVREDFNKNPRDYEDALQGPRKRAHWAHLNSFEAFPPFAAAVVIAHLANAPQDTVDQLAMAFLACRLAYGILYIANLDKLRTLAWTGGMATVVALFFAGAG